VHKRKHTVLTNQYCNNCKVYEPFRCFSLLQSSSMPAFDGAHNSILLHSAFFYKQMSVIINTKCHNITSQLHCCR